VATADLTVIGLGRSDSSAGEYIAEIQRRLAAQERVRYRLHAMGTYSVLKLDERRDKQQGLAAKLRSVQERLAEDR
jgi:uncharacterized protein YqgV (UPF0045/DUF77 family)